MRYVRALIRALVHALVLPGFCLSAGVAAAVPLADGAPSGPAALTEVIPVDTNCYSIGRKVASQNGGQLARAAPQTRGGRTVCVIVVLVPAKDGQRPRRVEFTVPAK
jgi:hypothetical protein